MLSWLSQAGALHITDILLVENPETASKKDQTISNTKYVQV